MLSALADSVRDAQRADLPGPSLVILGAVLLLLTAVLVWRSGAVWSWLCFGVASVLWFAVNGRVEGPVLLRVASQRGLTLADLVPLAAGVVLLLHGRRRD